MPKALSKTFTALLAPVTAQQMPQTAIVFLFLAPFIVLNYVVFVFNPLNMGNPFLYGLQLTADVIAVLVMLSLWITIFMDVFVEHHHRISLNQKTEFLGTKPTVDVFITAAGEPDEVVEKTVRAAVQMQYPHQVFLCDDGHSPVLRELAQQLNIHYITRTNRRHAKAGNLNHALRYSDAEFFAIFDADQVPDQSFLETLLPFLADPKVAMAQSPQHFYNTQHFIAQGTAQAQEVFYRYLCPAKNISNSAFCVGTNMIFRRSAIDQIGGIAQMGHSEDIWTSRLLHEQGWRTVFVNTVLASGVAPTTIAAFFKQQLRWSKGGLSMLFLRNPLSSKKLTLDQRLQYMSANMFYLVGLSMAIYLLLPLMYLLFGMSPLAIESSAAWLVHYLPYFALYYSLSWLLLGKLQISVIATSLASFWPYLLALFSIVFNTQFTWTATTARSEFEVKMRWIWPHVFVILLTVFALVVGWFEPRNLWNTFMSSVWSLWNMYLFIVFITSERRGSFAAEVGERP